MHTLATLTFLYGLEQEPVSFTLDVADDTSEIYISLHLPRALNQAKASVEVTAPVRMRGEVIYDQPDAHALPLVVLLVTAGASAVPFTGTRTSGRTTGRFHGTTGIPLTLEA